MRFHKMAIPLKSFVGRVNRLLISTLLCIVARLRSGAKEGSLVILCYHGIPDEERRNFSRQLDWIASRFIAVDLRGCTAVPIKYAGRRLAALTFDDALVTFWRNVLPELKSRSIPATVFVPTGYIGAKCGWMRSPEQLMRDEGRRVPERDRIQMERDEVMSEKQIRELDPALITVGSHTVSHQELTKMDKSAIQHELKESKSRLEGIIGKEVDLVSFPRGEYDSEVVDLCRKTGYSRAYSIEPEFLGGDEKNFVLGRIVVEPTDWRLEFVVKLLGGYSWMKRGTQRRRTT